ncbi:uncharacterized protein LOC143029220 [Oratosquilla oratoria]|uniref:uncharacterized protein LOC143029220 n=1 Tax=Oratosquilla oratoria TaxID=337810 RepID=UPI003F771035
MFVHGTLDMNLMGGSRIKDKDNLLFNIARGDWSDSYVTVLLDTTVIFRSSVQVNTMDPVWEENTRLSLCHNASYLHIKVWDKDYFDSELIGFVKVPIESVVANENKDDVYELEDSQGLLHLHLSFTPWHETLTTTEVPRCYFPERRGGSVVFYQDAHHTPESMDLHSSQDNSSPSAWEDIEQVLLKAKQFIYITGWSFYSSIRLNRRRDSMKIGEILKKRAEEGVHVAILIWNEKFSAGLCAGLIGTHDEDTEKFFEGSKVHVALVRRNSTMYPIKERAKETLFSHHQKAIVADNPDPEKPGKSSLVAFLGGLDLTDGRWDTPDHELFNTLNTSHREDFRNEFFDVSSRLGPRQPWHDVHCMIRGLASRDILRNFKERWRMQVREKASLMDQVDENDFDFGEDDEEAEVAWKVQVLRSIDNDSAVFSSERKTFLTSSHGHLLDQSIQHALVHVIRKAERFLYIESQYFVGASHFWSSKEDVATNVVPMEIAEKIASKIRAGESFRAYVVVPMCPEGKTDNKIILCSMVAILRWQFLTFQAMFRHIADALKEVGSTESPGDYLIPLCLAKMELKGRVSRDLPRPSEGSEESRWRDLSRFLIYVHSKLLIADDAVLVLGSPNLNERSLNGGRDTELAIMALQERGKNEVVTDGSVAAFRRSLWMEHTTGKSENDPLLADPSSAACARRINQLADDALVNFAEGEASTHDHCRFLKFPYQVASDGSVTTKENMETLPFLPVPVAGDCGYIPAIFTT